MVIAMVIAIKAVILTLIGEDYGNGAEDGDVCSEIITLRPRPPR